MNRSTRVGLVVGSGVAGSLTRWRTGWRIVRTIPVMAGMGMTVATVDGLIAGGGGDGDVGDCGCGVGGFRHWESIRLVWGENVDVVA